MVLSCPQPQDRGACYQWGGGDRTSAFVERLEGMVGEPVKERSGTDL